MEDYNKDRCVRLFFAGCFLLLPLEKEKPDTQAIYILVSKLHSETYKTVHLPLFLKSHCTTCSPVYVILYHVTGSCKGLIRSRKWINLTDSAGCSGPDDKVPPAPGTNQIAVFVEFRPLTSRKQDVLPKKLSSSFCHDVAYLP